MSELKVYTLLLLGAAAVFQNDHRIAFLETEWFQTNWVICLPIAALYGLMVATCGPLMNGAINANLYRKLLRFWNFSLALFSILGVYRVGGEFVQTAFYDDDGGLVATFCRNDYFLRSRSVYFWYFLFVTSKVAEMGDTVLLMVGGKPVRFIHWFHHIATMIYSFYIAAYLPAIGRWMSLMNFIVHSLMYTYYLLMAYRIRVPRFISMSITSLQIVQMFVGLGVSLAAYIVANWSSSVCQNGGYTVEAAILMYSIYVFLFVQFFVVSYLKKGSSKSRS